MAEEANLKSNGLHLPRTAGRPVHLSLGGWRETASDKVRAVEDAQTVCPIQPDRLFDRGVVGVPAPEDPADGRAGDENGRDGTAHHRRDRGVLAPLTVSEATDVSAFATDARPSVPIVPRSIQSTPDRESSKMSKVVAVAAPATSAEPE